MKTASATHQGYVRQNNEDRFLLMECPALLAVADGMGGHNAGEIASGIAVDSLRRSFEGHTDPIDEQALKTAVLLAGAHVAEYARKNPRCADMGTTLVLAVCAGEALLVANVGDSRAYLLRGGRLTQITRDHSMLRELIEQGALSPEQAASHPLRHMITRALGADKSEEPDVFRIAPEKGDVVLLCSDGLTDMLPDAEIEALLAAGGSLRFRAQKLLEAALSAGGKDNCTVLLGQIEEGGAECSQDNC